MKSKLMNVPRGLIKYHSIHPEPYGETIVVLLNDMVTDVYTHEDGLLYTESNNKALITYLKQNIMKDPSETIKLNDLTLRTIAQDDLYKLLHWFYEEVLPDVLEPLTDITKTFISHAVTYYAHSYIISLNQKPIGLIGYSVINDHAIINELIVENVHSKPLALLNEIIVKHIKAKNPIKALTFTDSVTQTPFYI
ncbi:MAG: hypothetical protein ACNA7U_02500 [Candidatus Izemoplasmataceae bacterium]